MSKEMRPEIWRAWSINPFQRQVATKRQETGPLSKWEEATEEGLISGSNFGRASISKRSGCWYTQTTAI